MKVFVGEKERPFDLELFCIFDTSLKKDFIQNFTDLLFGFEALPR